MCEATTMFQTMTLNVVLLAVGWPLIWSVGWCSAEGGSAGVGAPPRKGGPLVRYFWRSFQLLFGRMFDRWSGGVACCQMGKPANILLEM